MNLNDELKFIGNVFDINSFDWGAFLVKRCGSESNGGNVSLLPGTAVGERLVEL